MSPHQCPTVTRTWEVVRSRSFFEPICNRPVRREEQLRIGVLPDLMKLILDVPEVLCYPNADEFIP